MKLPRVRTSAAGASIVEVMVVVAIVGTLATLARQNYRAFELKSRYAASNLSMASVRSAIMGARLVERKTLLNVTGSACNFCEMGLTAGQDLSLKPPVQTANTAEGWRRLGFTQNPTDAWEIPIVLDENELEQGETDCRHDALWTAGADNVWGGPGAGEAVFGDDAIMKIPFYRQNENCQ